MPRTIVALTTSALSLALVAAVASGCSEVEPDYCEVSTPTCNCDVVRARCLPSDVDLFIDRDMAGPQPDLVPLCVTAKDCTPSSPVCNAPKCGPCSMEAECASYTATPHCGPKGGCVECLQAIDCRDKLKACNVTTQACGACMKNTDCWTGVCVSGACADPKNVYFVDNKGMPVGTCRMNFKGDGLTPATAFCEITEALKAADREYIVVAPSMTEYQPIEVSPGKAFTILTNTRLGASLYTNTGLDPAVSVLDGGNVTINGFKATSAPLKMTDVVVCAGKNAATSLTLLNSYFERSGAVGVRSTNCTLVLDSNLLLGNGSGGIFVDGKTYKITNNFIVDNGSTGVTLGGGANGSFAFNTVGGSMKNVGGVVCLGAQTLESSVVAQNNMVGGTQFSNCVLKDVVTGVDSAPMANMAVPSFVACMSPLANALPYCLSGGAGIDLVMPSGGMQTLTDHDYFGNPRPKSAGYDVGAQELQ